ncbi:hypothetical protein [Mycobacterium sp. 1274756.6]|uniref:DUF7676 family protein n=1 Tax=Mycobacterium sp. 1274756.6 TaxID=1834076 RepID=UPI0008017341|nr:hypothetical protein [Mycobacterium sp. 1274756.6]OBJ71109.1 hypothetical protein A5643_08375 [Mycobacterium sp. 1274756.6]
MTDPSPAVDAPAIVTDETGGREQRWALPTDEQNLLNLLHLCFEEYWDDIWFGIIMEGAAWEVAAPNAPRRISMYDGYATVDFGRWHFHLCIGEHTESGPERGRIRRCSRAEMYRRLDDADAPRSWGVRLFNGRDEQMMTILLPNPFLTNDQQLREHPDWRQLELWDRLRQVFLGLPADDRDRASLGYHRSAT